MDATKAVFVAVAATFALLLQEARSFGKTIGDRIRVAIFYNKVDATASLTDGERRKLLEIARERSGVGPSQLGKARKLAKLGVPLAVWDATTLQIELVTEVLVTPGAKASDGAPGRFPSHSRQILAMMQEMDNVDAQYLRVDDAGAIVAYCHAQRTAQRTAPDVVFSADDCRKAITEARHEAAQLEATRLADLEANKTKPEDASTTATDAESDATDATDATTSADTHLLLAFGLAVQALATITGQTVPEAPEAFLAWAATLDVTAYGPRKVKAPKAPKVESLADLGTAVEAVAAAA